jgi:hypothetical protein
LGRGLGGGHQHTSAALVAEIAAARPVDQQHVRAHVGQHHRRERTRPDRLDSSTRDGEQAAEGSGRVSRHAASEGLGPTLHAAAVLAADFGQGVGDLASGRRGPRRSATSNTLPLA